jgi:hypothetical protein
VRQPTLGWRLGQFALGTDTVKQRTSPIERVLRRVEIDEVGCWICSLGVGPTGYAYVNRGGLRDYDLQPAHRVMWESQYGVIPSGHQVHHLCGVRPCINPDHLSVLPHAEHLREHPRPRDPVTGRFTHG